MREIILDTETTGLDYNNGDKIIEIGCVELFRYIPTGKEFHLYINPKKAVSRNAFKVHGISNDFLLNKPIFKEIANEFLDFIKNDTLIIHNAEFDINFLNSELRNINSKTLSFDRVKDTLKMARSLFPGSPSSLDALCRKFKIDRSNRKKHSALLDSQLLSKVYLELNGGAQTRLTLTMNNMVGEDDLGGNIPNISPSVDIKKSTGAKPTMEEYKKHRSMVSKLKEPIWDKFYF
jgi:DNA polymerase III subunit epsilon